MTLAFQKQRPNVGVSVFTSAPPPLCVTFLPVSSASFSFLLSRGCRIKPCVLIGAARGSRHCLDRIWAEISGEIGRRFGGSVRAAAVIFVLVGHSANPRKKKEKREPDVQETQTYENKQPVTCYYTVNTFIRNIWVFITCPDVIGRFVFNRVKGAH